MSNKDKRNISVWISQEEFDKFEEIIERKFSDKTKQIREWINEHYDAESKPSR